MWIRRETFDRLSTRVKKLEGQRAFDRKVVDALSAELSRLKTTLRVVPMVTPAEPEKRELVQLTKKAWDEKEQAEEGERLQRQKELNQYQYATQQWRGMQASPPYGQFGYSGLGQIEEV